MRRVVITGLGAITPLGNNIAEFWQGIASGRCAIRRLETVPLDGLKIDIGAEVPSYEPEAWFDRKQLQTLDRFAQFALIAAREAVADAGLDADALRGAMGERMAVVVGSGAGGKTTDDNAFRSLYGDGNPRVSPMAIPRCMISAAPSQITMDLGLHGPAYAVSSACSSSNHAIGDALRMIRHGYADRAIAGGCEASITFGMVKAWQALRVISGDTCRPFSKDRSGMVIGEGAGMLVLETIESAIARGARIYAELAGFGASSDAGHLIAPSRDGACMAMRAALNDAGMEAAEIVYINAHGTATRMNDPTETAAIRELFGEHADRLLVSSTKSMHGHALGASSSFEAIATVLGMHHGIVPPTANFTEADPECDLDYVPNHARQHEVDAALSNAFAFGGLNAVLAFRATP